MKGLNVSTVFTLYYGNLAQGSSDLSYLYFDEGILAYSEAVEFMPTGP